MSILVVATARLVFRAGPPALPSRDDLKLIGGVAATLGGITLLKVLDLFALESERLFVAALAAVAAVMALARGTWPGPSTGTTLALLAAGVASWALLLSRTRSAWLGTIAGMAVVAGFKTPRALWLIPAGVAAVLILRPAPVIDRLTVSDASTRDRYYMWQAGADMIRDKPVFGQGPGMIPKVYPRYRWPEAPNPDTPHLHDNAMQIAAERGLPCLVLWVWLVAAAMADAYREARRGEPPGSRDPAGATAPAWSAVAAFALLTAVMVAGVFEYNFGDSEVLMLTLLVCSLPYALRRQREAAA
jgi:O-antigen ligase